MHRAGGSSREQPRGRVHWTEQRILEVTARRSPRGLATDHLQPAGRSLLYPGAAQSPPWQLGGAPGRLWGRGCPWMCPGGAQDQGGCRARAAAAGADTGDKAAARGTAGTKPTYIELRRAALRCKACHSRAGCPDTHPAFSSARKASSAAGTSWEEPPRPQEGRTAATTLVGRGKAHREKAL